jgi:hypothetical protein
MKKRVIGYDEQKGGERAALLDASLDTDPIDKVGAKKGRDFNIRKSTRDEVADPAGEAHPRYNVFDPIMIDRVKGLGGVQKKEKPVFLFL